jgi:hypothetical protein
MEKSIRIIEAVDRQILKDRKMWNGLLEGVWPTISLYIGNAFDVPIYSFRNFNDNNFNGSGTLIIAIKQPDGTLQFYHPFGCLFTQGKTLFNERMLVKLITFVEEQLQPRKKPYIRGNDVFHYSLQEVSYEKVSRMLKCADKAQEGAGSILFLIKQVKAEISKDYSS